MSKFIRTIREQEDRIRTLQADNVKLLNGLKKYSYHLAECAQGPFRYDFADPKPCDCGLNDMIGE